MNKTNDCIGFSENEIALFVQAEHFDDTGALASLELTIVYYHDKSAAHVAVGFDYARQLRDWLSAQLEPRGESNE